MKIDRDIVQKNYDNAKRVYALYGVDTDKAVEAAKRVKISLHCWQGDDVTGFEGAAVANQNVVTGNYPGRARNGGELRADIDKAFSFSPLSHKVNIHSFYAETKAGRGRDTYTAEDFKNWIDWAKERKYGLDFNVSFFAHPMMNDGMSLASPDKRTRDFWVDAGKAGREIAAEMGRATGQVCVNDVWVPDGLKDNPIDRARFRGYLTESLDRIFEKKFDPKLTVDVLEGKLFGIGTECFVVGSHEYYMMYAARNGVGLCMDTGHYLPTETVTDKLSVVTRYIDNVLLHISRGVRWDSDHVVILDDMLTSLFAEAKRLDLLGKIHIGLDYFDASINRIGAWGVGLRAAGKALVAALCEPTALLKKAEESGNYTERLILSEEFKTLPFAAVWDMFCAGAGVPVGAEWADELRRYEADVTGKRK
ncbi:MAG: L-rhamnose isomerase [Clostridiales bacterium]|jgi:L-rhamnose isomerase|nr:L-rhamnose isomerase [Clostridiales bacterium]